MLWNTVVQDVEPLCTCRTLAGTNFRHVLCLSVHELNNFRLSTIVIIQGEDMRLVIVTQKGIRVKIIPARVWKVNHSALLPK